MKKLVLGVGICALLSVNWVAYAGDKPSVYGNDSIYLVSDEETQDNQANDQEKDVIKGEQEKGADANGESEESTQNGDQDQQTDQDQKTDQGDAENGDQEPNGDDSDQQY